MGKLIVSLAAVCTLLAPIAALAAGTPSTSAVAASLCKQERVTMGTTNFNAAYGTNADKSNAYGKCVAKAASTAQQDVDNAAKACKAQLGADADANAYGKCVSAKVQSATAQQASKAGSAARSCRADLKADKAAFAAKWGTGTSAFGKCVSSKSKSK